MLFFYFQFTTCIPLAKSLRAIHVIMLLKTLTNLTTLLPELAFPECLVTDLFLYRFQSPDVSTVSLSTFREVPRTHPFNSCCSGIHGISFVCIHLCHLNVWYIYIFKHRLTFLNSTMFCADSFYTTANQLPIHV